MSNDLHAEREVRDSRYQVLVLLCVSASIAYIQRAALSVPAEEIAKDLSFADLARDMGSIQSYWYFAYAMMQIPAGWLADRFGSRRALVLFCIGWSLATLLAAFAKGYVSLSLMWALMGASQAGAFPCAAKALGRIFPDDQRARATGLLAAGMTIGGAIAPILAALSLELLAPVGESFGIDRWRLLLAAYSAPGILWAGFVLVFDFRSKTSHAVGKPEPSSESGLVSNANECPAGAALRTAVFSRCWNGLFHDLVSHVSTENARRFTARFRFPNNTGRYRRSYREPDRWILF